MNPAIRLTVTLAAISAIAAGALALTYDLSQDKIQAQQLAVEKKAIKSIFSSGYDHARQQKATVNGKEIKYYEIYKQKDDKVPAYFAIMGK